MLQSLERGHNVLSMRRRGAQWLALVNSVRIEESGTLYNILTMFSNKRMLEADTIHKLNVSVFKH